MMRDPALRPEPIILSAGIVLLGWMCLDACAAAQYGRELDECVVTSSTKEESVSCREEVMRRWCRMEAGPDCEAGR